MVCMERGFAIDGRLLRLLQERECMSACFEYSEALYELRVGDAPKCFHEFKRMSASVLSSCYPYCVLPHCCEWSAPWLKDLSVSILLSGVCVGAGGGVQLEGNRLKSTR